MEKVSWKGPGIYQYIKENNTRNFITGSNKRKKPFVNTILRRAVKNVLVL